MLLLETIETIGAIWLAMSVVGFILFAIIGKPRQQSVTAVGRADSAESLPPTRNAAAVRQVDKLRAMMDAANDKFDRDRKRAARKVPANAA